MFPSEFVNCQAWGSGLVGALHLLVSQRTHCPCTLSLHRNLQTLRITPTGMKLLMKWRAERPSCSLRFAMSYSRCMHNGAIQTWPFHCKVLKHDSTITACNKCQLLSQLPLSLLGRVILTTNLWISYWLLNEVIVRQRYLLRQASCCNSAEAKSSRGAIGKTEEDFLVLRLAWDSKWALFQSARPSSQCLVSRGKRSWTFYWRSKAARRGLFLTGNITIFKNVLTVFIHLRVWSESTLADGIVNGLKHSGAC